MIYRYLIVHKISSFQIAIDMCINDLEAYKCGKQAFKTHLECFEQDVQKESDHYEFKGHRLVDYNTNLTQLKSTFLNKLIDNIKNR